MSAPLKVVTFTVHASQEQSIRWKRAAESEGFRSVGTWLSCAADAYLKARARAGNPIPLSWRRGHFSVRLDDEELVRVQGHLSPPFAQYAGTGAGRSRYDGARQHTLVYLPESRIIATLKSYRQCQALASEMAPVILRTDASKIIERHRRESV